MDRHLGDASEAWVRARQGARARIRELARYAPEGLRAPRLASAEARELLRGKLAQLEGRPEGGGIRVSTAMPMRAVPFRAVFVMGLAEGLFPAADRLEALDLRQRPGQRRGSDLGRAEQDRYLFLEQILSARDALRLTYPSADPVTGDPRPRASVLEELLEILGAMTGDAEALVETHPLRRFDGRYFTPDADLRSLAPGAAREALALARGAAPEPPPLPASSMPPGMRRVSLDQLHAWLLEPAEGLARVRLGLRTEREDEAARGQEVLAPEAWEASLLERGVLAAALRGEEMGEALDAAWRALELEGRAPVGPPGAAVKAEIRERLEIWRRMLPPGVHRIHRFGAGDGAGDLLHPALEIETALDGRPALVRLEGRTRLVHADHLATVDRSDRLSLDRRLDRELRLLVDQTALAAAGLAAPARFLIVDGAGKVAERAVAPPSRDEARARLAAWIGAMLGPAELHRLPAAYAWDRSGLEPARWIERQDRRREPWGVLPGSLLRGLPAPDRETALRELGMRLGPLMEAAAGEGAP
jgi:exodeoxyribonuclease V gamma subunit